MNTKIKNSFENEVIMQITLPKIVDVSTGDYSSEKININTGKEDQYGEIYPFIIAHNQEITLKVETWKGTTITWAFPSGPYPMLLKKIYNDPANTATTIQIGY